MEGVEREEKGGVKIKWEKITNCKAGMLEMRERPIIFSGEMVRAILAGNKTQTRRVMKPQPEGEQRSLSEWSAGIAAACHDYSPDSKKLSAHQKRLNGVIFPFSTASKTLVSWRCPYGKAGDLLWVREKFSISGNGYFYSDESDGTVKVAWSSPIHMPREASRITLEITDVRVERLQDMTREDSLAEGMSVKPLETKIGILKGLSASITRFRQGWDKLNAKRGFSWDSNPWVWVIEFKKL